MDVHSNIGEGHLWSGCRDRVKPFLQRCHTRIVSARVSCGCCGWLGVPCCCFWCVARVSWHLRRLFGKWVRSEAGWVPVVWFSTPEAISANCIFFTHWIRSSWRNFYVTQTKRAEHRDWMVSLSGLRRAIITGELSKPSLLEVVSNNVGVWPLIVVYLKETGRRTDCNCLVVENNLHFFPVAFFFICSSCCFVLEEGNRWIL